MALDCVQKDHTVWSSLLRLFVFVILASFNLKQITGQTTRCNLSILLSFFHRSLLFFSTLNYIHSMHFTWSPVPLERARREKERNTLSEAPLKRQRRVKRPAGYSSDTGGAMQSVFAFQLHFYYTTIDTFFLTSRLSFHPYARSHTWAMQLFH